MLLKAGKWNILRRVRLAWYRFNCGIRSWGIWFAVVLMVIRSFLFLTNDGTPEGKWLSELMQLQRLDKLYLEIDTLAGFMGFNISEDANLCALFREAGCDDLLDLSDLKIYFTFDVKEKDVTTLLRYLMGMGKGEPEFVEEEG